jgi:signal transduction histidine kinase
MHIATLADMGPKPIAPSARHSHSAQFYRDDAYLIDELSRYIGAALIAGEAAVVIATKEHRQDLARQLQSRGLDITLAVKQGRYIALDAAETMAKFMHGGWPDAARFTDVADSILRPLAAAAGAHPYISAFGEMVALLWEQGNSEGAVRLEQLWNDVMRIYPMSLRCAYPIHTFDREVHGDSLLKICAEHNHVIPVESYTALITEEERHRSIIHLQQKAQALETEMMERKQVEETLRRTQSELENLVEQRTSALRQLTSRLLSLQDTERRRIARELHDSLGQYLVGLKLNIDMLRQTPESQQMWTEAEQLMQKCMAEVRTLSYLLHPPTMDAAGFVSAARWYVEGFGQRSGISVTLDTPENLGRLPDDVELAMFRVLQEALTNVHRHAEASVANVLIREDAGQVILEIQDNGRGIPEDLLTLFHSGAATGVGLAGIRERAWELGGKLKIESNNSGTVVRVSIPVSQNTST